MRSPIILLVSTSVNASIVHFDLDIITRCPNALETRKAEAIKSIRADHNSIGSTKPFKRAFLPPTIPLTKWSSHESSGCILFYLFLKYNLDPQLTIFWERQPLLKCLFIKKASSRNVATKSFSTVLRGNLSLDLKIHTLAKGWNISFKLGDLQIKNITSIMLIFITFH